MNEIIFSILFGSSEFIEVNSVLLFFNKESKYDVIESKFASYNFNQYFIIKLFDFLPFSVIKVINNFYNFNLKFIIQYKFIIL